jgi:hypothetical protein
VEVVKGLKCYVCGKPLPDYFSILYYSGSDRGFFAHVGSCSMQVDDMSARIEVNTRREPAARKKP